MVWSISLPARNTQNIDTATVETVGRTVATVDIWNPEYTLTRCISQRNSLQSGIQQHVTTKKKNNNNNNSNNNNNTSKSNYSCKLTNPLPNFAALSTEVNEP